MIVLVVNCGSSSLKYQLINMDNEEVMAKGLVEKIGLPDSQLTHKLEWPEERNQTVHPGSPSRCQTRPRHPHRR